MIKVNDKFEIEKTVKDEDVRNFAELSGDKNPLHLDDEYAKTTMFKQRISHGMLPASYISMAIGMHMPGIGTTYLEQDLKFKKPVFIGDKVKVCLEVTDLVDKGKFFIAEIKTQVLNSQGDVVIDGRAKVIPPKGDL